MRKGFVSSYFLIVLLMVSTIVAAISTRYRYRFEVIANLKIHEAYLESESVVIQNVQCELRKGQLEEGRMAFDSYAWEQKLDGEVLYVTLFQPIPEELVIQIDLEKKIVLSYSSNRYREISQGVG